MRPPVSNVENLGFLRSDATLSVLVVSDAADQSTETVSTYLEQLLNVKGQQRASWLRFSGVIPTLATAPSNCTYDDTSSNATRYDPLISGTGGAREEICNATWAAALQTVGQSVFGARTRFELRGVPDLAQPRTVRVNCVSVPSGCPTVGNDSCAGQTCSNWCFDGTTNAVRFSTAPAPGTALELEYTSACF